MCTWEEIGEKWSRAQQMGFQAIQAAMDVGDDLQQKKLEVPRGKWVPSLVEMFNQKRAFDLAPIKPANAQVQANVLMRLALHRKTIEHEHPNTMRDALALLPKVPRKTSEKQLAVLREDIDKYEEFAKDSVKKQLIALVKKKVSVELKRLQNQAHEAVTQELNATKRQLDKERKRISELMEDTDEKRQFYQDLINKQMNGYDYKAGMKTLKQALHPDRESISPALRTKAMVVLQHLERFLQI